jgi:hypothetical protein
MELSTGARDPGVEVGSYQVSQVHLVHSRMGMDMVVLELDIWNLSSCHLT